MGFVQGRWVARGSCLMLLAILLGGLAPDHMFGQDNHPKPASTSNEHSRHCHGDAASCSDVPLTTSGSVGNLSDSISSFPAVFVRGLLAASIASPSEPDWTIEDPPPRGA